MKRWIVVAEENDGSEVKRQAVATCTCPEDADHFILTCVADDLSAYVLEVETDEWVHPAFGEVASVEEDGEEG
jgi:hypothetical protein